ncbi:MAG: NFACT RNA binding domain-containing protein [Cyclobacteriaceae bacterium]|nr:NFACT RNA binding domain-containing protein [Cyclobacteriaceae bacterium]
MHNNYFLFKALCRELHAELQGGVISMCFSQAKDELVIQVEVNHRAFFIRALLLPVFSCLSFPKEFQRARKNSIDLFGELIGQKIEKVEVIENDRSFYFRLSSNAQLLFKMHGNRSNIILFKSGATPELFKKQLTADLQLNPDALCKKVNYTRAAFEENLNNLKTYFAPFGKPVWNYLEGQNFDRKDSEEKWQLFHQVLHELNHPEFRIIKDQEGPRLSLLNEPNAIQKFNRATDALTAFHALWLSHYTFQKEYAQTGHSVSRAIGETETLIQKLSTRLNELNQEDAYREYADLLMAHLHTIEAGAKEVVLPNFITGTPVHIKLKPELSPQKNAEIYYRKSRNRKIEIEHLQKQLAEAHHNLHELRLQQAQLKNIKDLKQLMRFRNNLPATGDNHKPRAQRLPYREVVVQGFVVRIGRSAVDNDALTFKHAHKNDLWLHARDVPGSHVIIRHQPGKPFPKEVIERAAQLAAWYSKRKTESLCPVMITERKYVRKRKGDEPGQVTVERERTILVEPRAE